MSLTVGLSCVFAGDHTRTGPFASTSMQIERLRCEYLPNPLGIDTATPRLSWRLCSEQRGQKQTAYQILAASSAAKLSDGRADMWDTGKIMSDRFRLPMQASHLLQGSATSGKFACGIKRATSVPGASVLPGSWDYCRPRIGRLNGSASRMTRPWSPPKPRWSCRRHVVTASHLLHQGK